MKKAVLIGLSLVIALVFYACRMRNQDVTTPDTTPAVTTAPEPTATEPTATEPTVTEPTIAPNVPDPDVDDDHLIDPTEDVTEDPDGLLGDIKRKLTGSH